MLAQTTLRPMNYLQAVADPAFASHNRSGFGWQQPHALARHSKRRRRHFEFFALVFPSTKLLCLCRHRTAPLGTPTAKRQGQRRVPTNWDASSEKLEARREEHIAPGGRGGRSML